MCMAFIQVIDLHMAHRRAGISSLVLRQMKQQAITGNLHVDGKAGLEAKFPVDRETEPIDVPSLRLLAGAYGENRNGALHVFYLSGP